MFKGCLAYIEPRAYVICSLLIHLSRARVRDFSFLRDNERDGGTGGRWAGGGGRGGEAKYFSNFSIFEVAGFMFVDGCLSPDVGLIPEKRFKRCILPLRGWIKFHSRLA